MERPTTIQKIGEILAVAWSDGREDYLDLKTLRAACPCAACTGEPDALGRLAFAPADPAAASAELKGWDFVGGYGFQPRWQDGHATGIYSFALLRRLGEDAGAQPP